jgi:hypothetical protein
MEISRSEAGFFHVAYGVKNSRGLSTGFHLMPKDLTQHTRDMNELCRDTNSRFQNSDFGTTMSIPSLFRPLFFSSPRPRRIGSARLTREKADWNLKRVTVLAQIQTLRFKLGPRAMSRVFLAPLKQASVRRMINARRHIPY